MKTNYSKAWECKPFIHVFLIFRLTEHMDMRLQSHTSYFTAWASNILSKAQAPCYHQPCSCLCEMDPEWTVEGQTTKEVEPRLLRLPNRWLSDHRKSQKNGG